MMPKFNRRSKNKLSTVDDRLKYVCLKAISIYDFSVLSGHRSPAEQFKLFKKGRKLFNGHWLIKEPDKIVTYCDGMDKKSNHNSDPSIAIDLAPYPIDWEDESRFFFLAGILIGIWDEADIKGKLSWGGNWRWKDFPHFEIKESNND